MRKETGTFQSSLCYSTFVLCETLWFKYLILNTETAEDFMDKYQLSIKQYEPRNRKIQKEHLGEWINPIQPTIIIQPYNNITSNSSNSLITINDSIPPLIRSGSQSFNHSSIQSFKHLCIPHESFHFMQTTTGWQPSPPSRQSIRKSTSDVSRIPWLRAVIHRGRWKPWSLQLLRTKHQKQQVSKRAWE